MRIYTISDIHVDYKVNRQWLINLSEQDYKNDILILAGDITSDIKLLEDAFRKLKSSFLEVLFVPGNHDLWVLDNNKMTSIEKFHKLLDIAEDNGVITKPFTYKTLSIVPLCGWYDYSFQSQSDTIRNTWIDYYACKWPRNFNGVDVNSYFTKFNTHNGSMDVINDFIISYSHFMPRIDIMPFFIPAEFREVYCVLGSYVIEEQIRKLGSNIHVYGHSHVNLEDYKNNTLYINNAYGYPYENKICAKKLALIYEI